MSTTFNRVDDFTYWVQQTIPQVYDDSLSFYEVLNKVVSQINTIGSLTNDLATSLEQVLGTELANAVTSKLIEWKDDGTLADVINQNIFADLNDRMTSVETKNASQDTVISGKVDTATFNTAMGTKANVSDVNALTTSMGLKVNKADLTYVHVRDGGVVPENADNSALLQTFINNNKGKVIQFDSGVYKLSKPLNLPPATTLQGENMGMNQYTQNVSTVLQRTTTDVDPTLGIDAIVIIIQDSPTSHTANTQLVDLALGGVSPSNYNAYGIYVDPSNGNSYSNIKNVHIQYVGIGYYTQHTWLSYINLYVQNCNTGIKFTSPGQVGTGTSVHFDRCYIANATGSGYDIYGLVYSTFTACACDSSGDYAYKFNRASGIHINGSGAEQCHGIISNWASTVTVTSMYTLSPQGTTPATSSAVLKSDQGGKTTFITCDWGNNLQNPGDTYNQILGNGSCHVMINTDDPTGGKNNLLTGGSKIVRIGLSGLTTTP
jgi:hypothetical protein